MQNNIELLLSLKNKIDLIEDFFVNDVIFFLKYKYPLEFQQHFSFESKKYSNWFTFSSGRILELKTNYSSG